MKKISVRDEIVGALRATIVILDVNELIINILFEHRDRLYEMLMTEDCDRQDCCEEIFRQQREWEGLKKELDERIEREA